MAENRQVTSLYAYEPWGIDRRSAWAEAARLSGRPVLQKQFQCDMLAANLASALQAKGAADLKR